MNGNDVATTCDMANEFGHSRCRAATRKAGSDLDAGRKKGPPQKLGAGLGKDLEASLLHRLDLLPLVGLGRLEDGVADVLRFEGFLEGRTGWFAVG